MPRTKSTAPKAVRKPRAAAAKPVQAVQELAAPEVADLAPAPAAGPVVEPVSNTITNNGTMTLHYGDGTGRRLHPGDSGEVPPAIVAIWRNAGFIA